jgi:hypothetical protein
MFIIIQRIVFYSNIVKRKNIEYVKEKKTNSCNEEEINFTMLSLLFEIQCRYLTTNVPIINNIKTEFINVFVNIFKNSVVEACLLKLLL